MQEPTRPTVTTRRVCFFVASAALAAPVLAQVTGGTGGSDIDTELRRLFVKSFDLFTVLLVLGSVISVAVIIQCVWEIRRKNIVPPHAAETISRLAKFGRWGELRDYVTREDDSMVSRVVRAALDSPGADRSAIREAAELAAGEESARWFRKIEPLNVVGNLGPLLGLAGTVWGMIIAFTTLTAGGGQADPNALAGGIAKALFHTLLGLLLAVPSLLTFGLYRTAVDKHCTRAMGVAGDVVEVLPESPDLRGVVTRVDQPGAAPVAASTSSRAPEPAGARR
jgi:biopolymer transport protein ExbB